MLQLECPYFFCHRAESSAGGPFVPGRCLLPAYSLYLNACLQVCQTFSAARVAQEQCTTQLAPVAYPLYAVRFILIAKLR